MDINIGASNRRLFDFSYYTDSIKRHFVENGKRILERDYGDFGRAMFDRDYAMKLAKTVRGESVIEFQNISRLVDYDGPSQIKPKKKFRPKRLLALLSGVSVIGAGGAFADYHLDKQNDISEAGHIFDYIWGLASMKPVGLVVESDNLVSCRDIPENGWDRDCDGRPNENDSNPDRANLIVNLWTSKVDGKFIKFGNPYRDNLIHAFKEAPVLNPDGSKGVDLVVSDRGPGLDFNEMVVDLNSTFERFELLLNSSFKYPYAINAITTPSLEDVDETALGVARGNNVMFTVISDFPERLFYASKSPDNVLMHEMGHTFGFKHNDGDSVMCDNCNFRKMTYSTEKSNIAWQTILDQHFSL